MQVGFGAAVHAGTEIDQPLRPFDQGGQQIGRKRVDGEDMGKAVGGRDPPLAIADARVVDHRVEAAELVDLFGDAAGPGDGREVADHDIFYFGQ